MSEMEIYTSHVSKSLKYLIWIYDKNFFISSQMPILYIFSWHLLMWEIVRFKSSKVVVWGWIWKISSCFGVNLSDDTFIRFIKLWDLLDFDINWFGKLSKWANHCVFYETFQSILNCKFWFWKSKRKGAFALNSFASGLKLDFVLVWFLLKKIFFDLIYLI